MSAPAAVDAAQLRALIRDVPDFPRPGILFKDIAPLIGDRAGLKATLDGLEARARKLGADRVVGIEARGFIFGGALAARLNASFVPARKPGKLPALSDKVSYKTEYSLAELEMHKDSIKKGARVVVVDDVLATGGTAKASAQLVTNQGGEVIAYAFVIELGFLKGRGVLERGSTTRVESVIAY